MDSESGTSAQSGEEFKVVFGEKDDVVIVLFCGKLHYSNAVDLEACAAQLKEKNHPIVLISFREVPSIGKGLFAAIAKLQKSIRDTQKLLALCAIAPEIKGQLQASGIIRDNEVFNNLSVAWQAMRSRLESSKKDSILKDAEDELKKAS